MRNSNRLAVFVLSALALVTACEDDPAQPAGDSSPYLPLTTRDAVLNNLEVAWDNRAPSKIDELLDDNFMFYFSPGDVYDGLPVDWSRTAEMAATNALFKSNTIPILNAPVCTSILLDLVLDGVTWDPIAPPAAALGEAWYTATVNYDFTFKIQPDLTYNSVPDAKVQLTVREVAVGEGTEWRLVEWRDLGNDLVANRQAAGTGEKTWGGIKALYDDAVWPIARDAVLPNLETAWNERSTEGIDELLDENFTFFFSEGDVGGEIPSQWGRADEMQTSHDLFISNSQAIPTGPACTSLHVDLSTSNLQWIEIIPEDYPAEIWYATTVFYSAWFEMEHDVVFIITPGAKGQFTVRDVGSGTPHFQLVEWRDLGNSNMIGLASSQATWGGIKALYH
jgi:hypothetical protein